MAEMEDTNAPEEDDSNWIWGIFYYNPNDKRLFPPKRVKWAGWTINFGNPFSIILLVIIIAIIVYINEYL